MRFAHLALAPFLLDFCIYAGPVNRLPGPAKHGVSTLVTSVEVGEHSASEGGWDDKAGKSLIAGILLTHTS